MSQRTVVNSKATGLPLEYVGKRRELASTRHVQAHLYSAKIWLSIMSKLSHDVLAAWPEGRQKLNISPALTIYSNGGFLFFTAVKRVN